MTIHLKRAEIEHAFARLIELTMIVRHYASYSIHPGCKAPTVAVKRDYGGPTKISLRPDYTYKEAEATAMWLNEREARYPVPATLAHLQEPDHDRNKRSARQDIGRSGRRRKAPR